MNPGARLAGAVSLSGLACVALIACASTGSGSAAGGGLTREDVYGRLLAEVGDFNVSGGVRTEEGLLLPELIHITVESEICIESRQPGSRFWSLDYDTCFAYRSVDSLDRYGKYEVSVPFLDADRSYETSHSFGDLRLVQRGPVSFVAESDAGWRHQETFTSSRSETRDVILSLDTDTFWVVEDAAELRARPATGASVLDNCRFGSGIEVIRFHQGWAECVWNNRIGWMEMRFLGTEEEKNLKEPFKGKPGLRRRAGEG